MCIRDRLHGKLRTRPARLKGAVNELGLCVDPELPATGTSELRMTVIGLDRSGLMTVGTELHVAPVSYTHLDVYKRQLIDVQQQLQGLASGLSDRSGVGVGIAKRPVQRPRPLAQATLGCLLYTSTTVASTALG